MYYRSFDATLSQRRFVEAKAIELGSNILHIAPKHSKSCAYSLRCYKKQHFFLQSAMAAPSVARQGPRGRNPYACTTHPLVPTPPPPLCMSCKIKFSVASSRHFKQKKPSLLLVATLRDIMDLFCNLRLTKQ